MLVPEADESSPTQLSHRSLSPAAKKRRWITPTYLLFSFFTRRRCSYTWNPNSVETSTSSEPSNPLSPLLNSSPLPPPPPMPPPCSSPLSAIPLLSTSSTISPPSAALIVTPSVGVNHIDLAECRRRGISIANAGDAYSEDTADTAVGLLIDVLRKITAGDRYVRNGSWKVEGDLGLRSKLGGKRVGIVGLGKIGTRIAKRLNAFGCKILYTSRKQKSSLPYTFYSDICSLANDSDILVLSCVLTEETKHLVNKEVLTALGKGGILINIARGAVVDEEELVRCLVEGRIAGAGLDVFEHEPLIPKELLEMDNVPHMAIHTTESYRGIFECVIANLKAFFSGQPLLPQVLL